MSAAIFCLTLAASAAAVGGSAEWRVVNDTVMGGRSSGRVDPIPDGLFRFSGDLSLEGGGGFASVRSVTSALDLAEAEGLRVRIRGDGREWALTLRRSDVLLRAGSYRAPLQTAGDGEQVIELYWSDFVATSYGREVPDAPPVETGLLSVNSIGLLLADGQPGPFGVDLVSVEAIAGEASETLGSPERARVGGALMAAIRLGVPAFNGGRPEVCAAHYRTAIESVLLLQQEVLGASEQRLLRRALMEGETQSASDAAWTYRRAMDRVIAASVD